MGILTTVYQISPELLGQFLADGDNLDIILYADERSPEILGLAADWQPPLCRFDKQWDDMICAIKGAGFKSTAVLLETVQPIAYKYSDHYIRYWTPDTAVKLATQLTQTSAEEIKHICAKKGNVRDDEGYIFGVDARYSLDYVLSSYDQFATFVQQAIVQEQIIIAISA